MRSSGAVKVLAAAPAMAPAEKTAASRGTMAKAAGGFLRSWDGVGMKSWCSLEPPVAKVRAVELLNDVVFGVEDFAP